MTAASSLPRHWIALVGCFLLACGAGITNAEPVPRLSLEQLDVTPSANWISGEPGNMQLSPASCRTMPDEAIAERILAVALQEWAWFGFPEFEARSSRESVPSEPRVRRPRVSEDEASRIATTIAGYWAATPGGAWILGRQNERWIGPDGVGARWRDAWSAAFISWVLCEGGAGSPERFRGAIAHHSYIDQAIMAAQGQLETPLYRAYDIGLNAIQAGDMLCTGSRPEYRNLAARKAQLGEGARTHCDIVVGLDANGYLVTVGGNVQSLVRIKRMPWVDRQAGIPQDPDGSPFFAHLVLQAPTTDPMPLSELPVLQQLGYRP